MSLTSPRLLHRCCLLALVAGLSSVAQQGAVQFQHFHAPPAGSYTTQSQAFRNGNPMGSQQSQTACVSPLDAAQKTSAMRLGNNAAANCTMHLLQDEERSAAFEQVCSFGPQKTVIHTEMKLLDPNTLSVDTQISAGTPMAMTSHSVAHYNGGCSPGEAAAAAGAMKQAATPIPAKMDPEQCKDVPQMRKDTVEGLASCKDLPAAYQSDCVARLQGSLRVVQDMEARCK